MQDRMMRQISAFVSRSCIIFNIDHKNILIWMLRLTMFIQYKAVNFPLPISFKRNSYNELMHERISHIFFHVEFLAEKLCFSGKRPDVAFSTAMTGTQNWSHWSHFSRVNVPIAISAPFHHFLSQFGLPTRACSPFTIALRQFLVSLLVFSLPCCVEFFFD